MTPYQERRLQQLAEKMDVGSLSPSETAEYDRLLAQWLLDEELRTTDWAKSQAYAMLGDHDTPKDAAW